MITLTDKTACCGCRACANSCPKGCIEMRTDEEGFLYPHADPAACVNCGLCEKVCPVLHKPAAYPVRAAYAAKHSAASVQAKSSSGGLFSALADAVLQQGGAVFGAAFDRQWGVAHICVETPAELDRLRRSKYVQSDTGTTFRQAKQLLQQGRTVLFTGTPCQIAGLRNYLGGEYENLLTAELFCHGVPSPAVWQKFLAQNTQKENISAIDFRCKRFGWDASFLNITYKDGSCLPRVPTLLRPVLYAKKGRLFRRFCRLSFGISSLYERPSCHACRFKGLEKMADFTLGDLWGARRTWPSQYDKRGVSALLVNTRKAQEFLQRCAVNKQAVDVQAVAAHNPYLLVSTRPHPNRAEFFARYQTEDFNKLVKKLAPERPLSARLVAAVRKICRLKNRKTGEL